MTLRIRLFAAAALACAAAGLSCSRSDNVLHLYTSLDSQEAPRYVDAFQRETGVRVRWVRLSAGEALARLEAERNNPQVSVWFGGPAPEFIVAAQRGLLEPYAPELDFTLPDDARGAGDAWTGFYRGFIGFICNEQFLAERQMACPRSWDALLDPRLRGHISVAYPYTSGTAYVLVVALLELMGEDAGWEYIRQLDGQVQRYNSSGTAAVTQVGMGEAGVGIAFAHDILKKGVERGYPVVLGMPGDGTPPEVGAVALVRGGRQPELAAQFVDWLLGRQAQDLLAEFYRVPINPSAQMAEGTVTGDALNVIRYDPEQAARDQPAILGRWRQLTGR
ncbi:MAG TPA: ABC transporter substrate-binding protein [Longimicrobiales bacterium]|nr:ABC transporter substrate-binding protein [Longimicrobiales bacterium]